MNNTTQDKYIGTLIGGIAAEVLGSQSEGMTPSQIKECFNGRVQTLPQGKLYTDDGEMTLVLARHLVKNGHVKMDEVHAEYGAIMGNKGYSHNTRNILNMFKEHPRISSWVPAGKSSCDGSVMRIAPIGLMEWDTPRVLVEVRAAIYHTHGDSKESVFSAFLHSRLINAMVNNRFGDKYQLFAYAMGHAKKYPGLWAKMNLVRYCLNSNIENITAELLGDENAFQIEAIDALCCAFYLFFKHYDDPREAVIQAASLGGDTDTIAKMVGDLCGACHGTSWIPREWHGFEGEEEFVDLAKQLYSKQTHV